MITIRTALGCVAILLLLPVAAQANEGPYAAVRGGLAQSQTASFDVGTTAAVVNGIQEKYQIGYAGELAAGYELGPLRVEAELSQKRARLSSLFAASTATVPNSAAILTSKGAGTFAAPTGRSRTTALMANAILSTTNRELFADGNVHFFGGAGIGYAWARAFSHRAVSGANPYLAGGAKSFAWQLVAGARYDLDKHLSIEAEYKYFTATRLRFTDTAGRRLSGSQTWNGFMIGASYAF